MEKNSFFYKNGLLQSLIIIFAAVKVEGFDLIATTEKNAKIVLLPL